jgi:hypothetical protein
MTHVPALGSPFVQQFNTTSSPGADSIRSFRSAKTAEASPISDTGYYSVAESLSSRSGHTCTSNMSDLIINTGLEEDYINGVSLLQVSSLAEQRKSGFDVLQSRKQQDDVVEEQNGCISNTTLNEASDRHSCDTDAPSQNLTRYPKSHQNEFTPRVDALQTDRAARFRTPVETYGSRHRPSAGPAKPLSPLSEPFFPYQTPRRSSDIYDIDSTNAFHTVDRAPEDYFLNNGFLPSDSSDSSVAVSSAAEDDQLFADDDYQYLDRLKGE